jgi:hypothetical protein
MDVSNEIFDSIYNISKGSDKEAREGKKLDWRARWVGPIRRLKGWLDKEPRRVAKLVGSMERPTRWPKEKSHEVA